MYDALSRTLIQTTPMTQLNQAFTLFLSSLVEALPFLLLGIVISSWLLVFVNEHSLASRFPRHPLLAAFVGSGLGLLLPVFQYGNIPVARRLLLQGVPVSAAISFLIAAPTINIIVIPLTWIAFPQRPEIVLLRIVFTALIAIIIGWIFSTYQEKRSLSPTDETTEKKEYSALLQSGSWLIFSPSTETDNLSIHQVGKLHYGYQKISKTNQPLSTKLRLFLQGIIQEFIELGTILAVGCAIAAAINLILPQAQILNGAQTSVTGILVMMLFATIFSVGSIADTFVGRTFMATFSSGSVLAFLLWGSIIDLKAIGLMLSAFRLRAVFYLAILALQLTFLLTLLVDFSIG